MSTKSKIYQPPANENAHVKSLEDYRALYERSINDPDAFWTEHAERMTWIKKWDKLQEWNYETAQIKWFLGGKINACYNCVDRHVAEGRGEQVAILWEGNDPSESRSITYNDLLADVQKAANALLNMGIQKGDRVCIYLQMIPELAVVSNVLRISVTKKQGPIRLFQTIVPTMDGNGIARLQANVDGTVLFGIPITRWVLRCRVHEFGFKADQRNDN